jgi:hypothetical protein
MLFLIILILSFLSGFFLPWWMVAVIAFLASLILGKRSVKTFFSGFGGVAIAWAILALIKSIPNNHILATRVSKLFQLPHWSLILLVTALIGGLVGGMAAWSGVLLKKAFKN